MEEVIAADGCNTLSGTGRRRDRTPTRPSLWHGESFAWANYKFAKEAWRYVDELIRAIETSRYEIHGIHVAWRRSVAV